MADTTTFFAQISSFFSTFFAYVVRALSLKHRSTTLCDDLELGIPSLERRVSNHLNRALPVVSGSHPVDGFVDVSLADNKVKETKAISIATLNVPEKTITDTDQSCHFQSTVTIDRSVPVLFSAIPIITEIGDVDNCSKHQVFQFGPYSLEEDRLKRKSRRRQDSFNDLLDLFPAPPTYMPPLPPVITEGVVVPRTVETTPLATENCPSPVISEEESSCESNSISFTDPSISISISISISNETANTSVHEILELPCTSAIYKVLSSGIDIKDKNISRLTLIHNPEILVSPAADIGNPSAYPPHVPRVRPQSFCAFTDLRPLEDALAPIHNPEDSSHGPVDKHADIGNPSAYSPPVPHVRPQSFCAFTDLQPLEDAVAPIPSPEDSSHRPVYKHTSVQEPFQAVPAAPTKYVRPYVAPLRIVKKNKVRLPVIPLEPPVLRRPLSGNWEQAMDDVLQAFKDVESEDGDLQNLFSGNDSFVTQSSEVRDDRSDLDDDHEEDGDGRLEESFYSIDENLSMAMAPPDLVAPKVEVPSSVSLSSERAVFEQVMEAKDQVNVPELRLCDCEGCEDSLYSWTAVTDDDDDNRSQEDDQWSEGLELDESS